MLLLLAAAGPAAADDLPVEQAPVDLEYVEDRTELNFEDRAAYFALLDHAQRVDPAELAAAAEEFRRHRWSQADDAGRYTEDQFPVFVDLFLHPDAYRGRPVTLRGHIIGPVIPIDDDNEFGVETLYQAHLFANDSQANPATVMFTERPAGIDLNAEIIDNVTVTGYFLKLHVYNARSGQRQIAPLILARTIRVRPPASASSPIPTWVVAAGVVLAFSGVIGLIVLVGRKDRRRREQYRRRLHQDAPPVSAAEDFGTADMEGAATESPRGERDG